MALLAEWIQSLHGRNGKDILAALVLMSVGALVYIVCTDERRHLERLERESLRHERDHWKRQYIQLVDQEQVEQILRMDRRIDRGDDAA